MEPNPHCPKEFGWAKHLCAKQKYSPRANNDRASYIVIQSGKGTIPLNPKTNGHFEFKALM